MTEGKMVRQNSVMAYHHLIDSGKLSAGHAVALKLVTQYGPGTSGEILAIAARQGYTVAGLWKRFSELKQMGLIEEIEDRKCAITGRTAAVLFAKIKGTQGELFQ